MHSDRFKPQTQVDIESLKALFREPTRLEKLNAKLLRTSSAEDNYEGQNAIDGDPATFWHTRWSPAPLPYPHEIQIELGESITVAGVTCLPRQDGSRNGWIAGVECFVSDEAANWGLPAAKGAFDNSAALKTVRFDAPRKGRFIRLVALRGFGNDPFASLAEIDLLTE